MKFFDALKSLFSGAHGSAVKEGEYDTGHDESLSDHFAGQSNLTTLEADPYKMSALRRALKIIENGKIGKAVDFLHRQMDAMSGHKGQELIQDVMDKLKDNNDHTALSIFKHSFGEAANDKNYDNIAPRHEHQHEAPAAIICPRLILRLNPRFHADLLYS